MTGLSEVLVVALTQVTRGGGAECRAEGQGGTHPGEEGGRGGSTGQSGGTGRAHPGAGRGGNGGGVEVRGGARKRGTGGPMQDKGGGGLVTSVFMKWIARGRHLFEHTCYLSGGTDGQRYMWSYRVQVHSVTYIVQVHSGCYSNE